MGAEAALKAQKSLKVGVPLVDAWLLAQKELERLCQSKADNESSSMPC